MRTQQAVPTGPSSLRDGNAVAPGTAGGVTERARLGNSPVASAPATPDGDTATPTLNLTDGGTPPEGQLAVAAIHADAAGNDNENLTDEYVILENTGDEALDLAGWTLSDDAGHTYSFPDGFILDAGARVAIYTGSGTDTESELYWGRSQAVWNNGGDTITVRDADGTIVLEESY